MKTFNLQFCVFPVATTYGDPHIVTLDGVEYTFNGFGEYHILKVADLEFELQGRMQPLIDENGETARATIYTAFAMRENSSDVVQVTFGVEAITKRTKSTHNNQFHSWIEFHLKLSVKLETGKITSSVRN